jgi:cystathionine beta-synthase
MMVPSNSTLAGVDYRESVLDTVGRTPLVRIRALARDSKAPVLAKLEAFNPAGA